MNLPTHVQSADVVELQLPKPAREHLASLRADHSIPWERLPDGSRQRAKLRELLVLRLHEIATGEGLKASPAADALIDRLDARGENETILRAAASLARSGNARPDRASLLRWARDYRKHGLVGLADGHRGQKRKWHGWEPIALSMWLTVGRQDPGSIAFWLRDEGYETATYTAVRRFIKTLPETLGHNAPQRVGKHHYQQNFTPYHVRDYSNIPVGFCWTADGHAVDWYTAHPLTGKPARLELVVWIDWRSHYVTGWVLWDRESALSTLFSLSRAMIMQDQVPGAVHVDRGSGFTARLMTEDVTGYFERFSIDPLFARAQNARGKGLVEGFFKHLEARLGKLFATYCGHDRTDDGLRRLQTKIKRGEIHLPTYQEVTHKLTRYMNAYNRAPQESLGGQSPADLWAHRECAPLHTPAEAVVRLSKRCHVGKNRRIKLSRRLFSDIALADHLLHDVIVEFDPLDWSQVWVYDLRRRFVCVAAQVESDPALPDSYIADQQKKRLAGQIRREELAIEEKKARAGLTVEAQALRLDAIEALNERLLTGEPQKNTADADTPAANPVPWDIDPYDTNY